MPGLTRDQRIEVSSRQVTYQGTTGGGGVFVVGYINKQRKPTLDIRYFRMQDGKHKSTRFGVVLPSISDAVACAQAVVDVIAEMERNGFKDPA